MWFVIFVSVTFEADYCGVKFVCGSVYFTIAKWAACFSCHVVSPVVVSMLFGYLNVLNYVKL